MKKIYIAPIAGVTDYTFRGILEDFKPDLISDNILFIFSGSLTSAAP